MSCQFVNNCGTTSVFTVHGEQEFECEDVHEVTEILPLPVERDFVQFARELSGN